MRLPRALHSGVRVLHADGTTMEMPAGEAGWREPTKMRRFVLHRMEDVSGVSGVGPVAEGIMFSDGTVVLRWTVENTSTAIYEGISDVIMIHGHDGKTVVRWVDG